jgi:hypothetical protein
MKQAHDTPTKPQRATGLKWKLGHEHKGQSDDKGTPGASIIKAKNVPKMGSGKVFEWVKIGNGKQICSHPDHHNTTNPSKPC